MNQEEQWLLEEKYNGVESEAFQANCERLSEGEPLAYLIGSIPFLGCTIYLDSHPLIPRPETEFWVEKAIEEIKKTFQSIERFSGELMEARAEGGEGDTLRVRGLTPYSEDLRTGFIRVLDLCAGSGCIGVAVAKQVPSASIDFTEIDEQHVETILKNCITNDIDSEHVQVLIGNLFERCTKKYHFILSNPPYIDKALNHTDASVIENEPHIALYGGAEGLEIIKQIISEAAAYLLPDGVLYIEHETQQADAIMKLGSAHHFHTTTHSDQYGMPRYSTLRMAQLS